MFGYDNLQFIGRVGKLLRRIGFTFLQDSSIEEGSLWLTPYWSVCTPQRLCSHFNIDLCFLTLLYHALIKSALPRCNLTVVLWNQGNETVYRIGSLISTTYKNVYLPTSFSIKVVYVLLCFCCLYPKLDNISSFLHEFHPFLYRKKKKHWFFFPSLWF